jgi:hypothetical protein
MFRSNHQLTTRFATAIVVVALGIPAAATARVDDNIPSSTQQAQGDADLRSPDATNAPQIGAEGTASRPTDLRSPDAKDSGHMAQSPEPVETVESATSFDWGDAGIGAGSALGLLLITVSAMFAVIHRRSRGVTT